MKIIVHIGAGKTGTSSIQETLKKNQDKLNALGFHYMGLILEHASVKKYSWQNFPAGNFAVLDDKTAYNEALDIINSTIKGMSAKGIHTLIWSNESFLAHSQKIIPILKTLEKDNEIEIIAYVRKHESWIRSAYTQWGIKHKTYKGRIKSFKEWYTPNRVAFYKSLKPYLENFQSKVFVKNMGAQKNLVKSFLDLCKINDESINILKSNESPSNEELLLMALYNNQFDGVLLPTRFEQQVLRPIVKHSTMPLRTPTEYFDSLMPTNEDIAQINKDAKEDRDSLNTVLESLGEEKFTDDSVNKKTIEINDGKLLMLLSQIVLSQSLEINKLKKKINEITEKIES